MAKMTKQTGMLIILLIVGSIFGSLLGEIFGANLPFLNVGKKLGFGPTTVELAAISLTLGIYLKINIATILGFFLALFIYTRL
ncbi:MAG: DUF4321 domain-containing protein [Firmicutes bacterium]|nr:DUF4321 domain-containing protein [Bacillota bacterium]